MSPTFGRFHHARVSRLRGLSRTHLTGIAFLALAACLGWMSAALPARAQPMAEARYQAAKYDPIHFAPAIAQATNEQCLACHREVLAPTTRAASPAGVAAATSKAWYQTTSIYSGAQDTFHRRHLETPLARQLMNLRCTTCHQGHDPRDENPHSSATSQRAGGFTLRKVVVPEQTCLKCHGKMDFALMGLPEPWPKSRETFQNNCLLCHAAIRTTRHQVNYLEPAAIEEAGKANSDVCYGCHGGRSWYRIAYPYTRHAWEGMSADVPDWAAKRPTQTEARFLPAPQGSTK